MTTRRFCDDSFSTLSWRQRCICVAGLLTCLLVGAALCVYLVVLNNGAPEQDPNAPLPLRAPTFIWNPRCPMSLAATDRFDCFPEDPEVSRDRCSARGCCWRDGGIEPDDGSVPKCFYPNNYGYRTAGRVDITPDTMDIPLVRIPAPSRYGDDILNLQVRVEMQTPYRLRIKIFDPENDQYEVTSPVIPDSPDPALEVKHGRLYSVSYRDSPDPFSVRVRREKTGTVIFDTSVGGTTVSHQFLQLSTLLPSSNVYGLGEHRHGRYLHDLNWRTWPIFSRKPSPEATDNLSGAHPIYMCVEDDGNAHAVVLLNSNPLEVQLQPTPAMTFRTIGGIMDFYVLLGPTPEDVVKQYTEAVGRPMLPPYWALGLHFGREGYLSTSDVRMDLEKLKKKNIPVDAIHLGMDYASDYATFTVDEERFGDLAELQTELKGQGQRLVVTVEPAVSTEQPVSRYPAYNVGLEVGVFVNDTWGVGPLKTRSRSVLSVYPDFGNPATGRWWTENLQELFMKLHYSGIIMNRNEPTAEDDGSRTICKADNLNKPPYVPRIRDKTLFAGTLCMDATHRWKDTRQRHYNVHNLYGYFMTVATDQAIKSIYEDKRSLLLSSSTFLGSGKYVGHIIHYSDLDWPQVAASIPAVLEFSLFGIPLVGTNMCGDNSKASEELCLRLTQLSAFFPLCVSYNPRGSKEMTSFSDQYVKMVRHILHRRYELLPHLYTLFYFAQTTGSTVVRPLLHEFYRDNNTYGIDHQFLWGSSLMVTAVLNKGETSVPAYFPAGRWFDYYTGKEIKTTEDWEVLDAPLYNLHKPINLHIRGGHIIPVQHASSNTEMSRRNSLKLLVALDSQQQAKGSLYWDDGERKDSHQVGEYIFVTFNAKKNRLEVAGETGRRTVLLHFEQVHVLGLTSPPTAIRIDGSYTLIDNQYHWDSRHKVLHLKNIIIPLARRTIIEWTFV